MHSKDKPWFDVQYRHAFDLNAGCSSAVDNACSRVNLEGFVCCQVRANYNYKSSLAMCQFSVRNRDVLMNAQSPHKCRFSIKPAVFGLSSSLPLLVGGCGGLVYLLFGTAHLLSVHFAASSPICHSLVISLLVLPPKLSVKKMSD